MLAVVLLGAAAAIPARADSAGGQKPLVVVAFAGYDALVANAKTLGAMAGREQLAAMLEGMVAMATQGKGLAGLDKARPWGAVVYANEEQFPVLGFVPVSDLKQLVALIPTPEGGKPLAPDADGVYKIEPPTGKTSYVSQKGAWAIVAQNADDLKNAPADPAALLGDLNKKYLVAVKASVKNVPTAWRDKFFAQIKTIYELSAQQASQSGELPAILANLNKQNLDKAVALSKELDEVLVGLSLDAAAGASLDFEITALPGTKAAQQMAQAKEAKSDLTGFLIPGAALTALSAGTMSDADVEQVKELVAKIRVAAAKDLDGNDDLSAEQKKIAKQLLSDGLDVLEKTVDARKSQSGMALLLEKGAPTVVCGMALAEGEKLDTVLKTLFEAAQKEQPQLAEKVKWDAGSLGDVKFHTATVDIPDEEAAAVLGKTVDIVVGIGPNTAYLGAGKNPLATLKQVIENSKKEPGKSVPPFQLSLTVTPIAQFIAQVAPADAVKMVAGSIAQMLATAAGKDHITLTCTIIPNGIGMRLNVETGVLKAILSAIPLGPPGPGKGPAKGKSPGGGDPF
jgi:hypothetical protein